MGLDRRPWLGAVRGGLLNQSNLVLLGGAGVLSLAAASWVPLAAGLVGECLWLAWCPARLVLRAKGLRSGSLDSESGLESVLPGFEEVPDPRRQKLAELAETIQRLRVERGRRPPKSPTAVAERLAVATGIFRHLGGRQQRLAWVVEQSPRGALVAEMEAIRQALQSPLKREVRAELQQALGVGQSRLRRLLQVEMSMQTLAERLAVIEAGFVALAERAASSPDLIEEGVEQLVRDACWHGAATEREHSGTPRLLAELGAPRAHAARGTGSLFEVCRDKESRATQPFPVPPADSPMTGQ